MPGFELFSQDGIFFDILIYNKTEDAVEHPSAVSGKSLLLKICHTN